MAFNSIPFFCFFLLFIGLYWGFCYQNITRRNVLILLGSLCFYAYTDYRLLGLVLLSTGITYALGLAIEKAKNPKTRNAYVYAAMGLLLLNLAFFKYYNFFAQSVNQLGLGLQISTLDILLPLGISFYTFRLMSYILDIDKKKAEACQNPLLFFNYTLYFPSIISGPIDRARLLIPQFQKEISFDQQRFSDAGRQFLLGLFKKIVIADNIGQLTATIFGQYETLPASTLVLGAFLYTIQLYTDFSGYSDMAIGVSRMLGIDIAKNFDNPFFAQNIADFWRKWHISLTSWLTDYVFAPLNIRFRDYEKYGLLMAVIINFTVIGFWHGANWTYVAFGLLHGLYYIPLVLGGKMNKRLKYQKGQAYPKLKEFLGILKTFALVMLANVLFFSKDLQGAFSYYRHMFAASLFKIPELKDRVTMLWLIPLIFLFLCWEWKQKDQAHALQIEHILSKPWQRMVLYQIILLLIIFLGAYGNTSFIYFNF
jgi:alginate O-acetyltransferase complex protein AlgI